MLIFRICLRKFCIVCVVLCVLEAVDLSNMGQGDLEWMPNSGLLMVFLCIFFFFINNFLFS